MFDKTVFVVFTDEGIFGVPLSTVVEHDRQFKNDTDVPLFLQKVKSMYCKFSCFKEFKWFKAGLFHLYSLRAMLLISRVIRWAAWSKIRELHRFSEEFLLLNSIILTTEVD